METLITLIIVVVAALLSKKKKDRGAALPEEKTTLPSSPWDDLPVEKIDYPMSIGGIVLGVSHHYDGRTFLIQFGQ